MEIHHVKLRENFIEFSIEKFILGFRMSYRSRYLSFNLLCISGSVGKINDNLFKSQYKWDKCRINVSSIFVTLCSIKVKV